AMFLAALLVPNTAAQELAEPFHGELTWSPRFRGVDHVELVARSPRLMRGQAIRIDLTAPGIEFLATPPMADKQGTAGPKTSTFWTRYRCQVAINGGSFAPVRTQEGGEQTLDGLLVSRGKVVSKGNGKYDALLLSKKNRARVMAPPFDLKDVHNAV